MWYLTQDTFHPNPRTLRTMKKLLMAVIGLALVACGADPKTTTPRVDLSHLESDPVTTIANLKKLVETRGKTAKSWFDDKLAAGIDTHLDGTPNSKSWCLRLNVTKSTMYVIRLVEMSGKTVLVYQYMDQVSSVDPTKDTSVLDMVNVNLELKDGKWIAEGTRDVDHWVGAEKDIKHYPVVPTDVFRTEINPLLKNMEEVLQQESKK